MIEVIFLFSWTALFLMGVFLIWKKIVSRNKLYVLLLLNLVFLAGVFCFFDIWGQV